MDGESRFKERRHLRLRCGTDRIHRSNRYLFKNHDLSVTKHITSVADVTRITCTLIHSLALTLLPHHFLPPPLPRLPLASSFLVNLIFTNNISFFMPFFFYAVEYNISSLYPRPACRRFTHIRFCDVIM